LGELLVSDLGEWMHKLAHTHEDLARLKVVNRGQGTACMVATRKREEVRFCFCLAC